MASFTDQSQSGSSLTDNKQVATNEDTNVNRFVFAELILGDIVLGLGQAVSHVIDAVSAAISVSDDSGSSITHTDNTLNASISYNEINIMYDQDSYTYNGVKVGPGFVDNSE